MRRTLINCLLIVVLFSTCTAKATENAWEPGDFVGNGSRLMFDWLAAKMEEGYVIGTFGKEPSFSKETPDAVYFRGNGVCELVNLEPAGKEEVVITRGTWKIADDELEMVLTSRETYGAGTIDELVPPVVETFAFADWQETSFKVHEPTVRMFEGVATELKREYLVGRAWGSLPYVAGYSAPIVLTLEEDGSYELFYLRGGNLRDATEVGTTTEWGTWAIVNNELELTQTSHGNEELREELDPPVVDAYEITGLQYVFDVPKEYAKPFIQCDGLMYLGQQLTMYIGETQFWN